LEVVFAQFDILKARMIIYKQLCVHRMAGPLEFEEKVAEKWIRQFIKRILRAKSRLEFIEIS
jgi:hypothetical protein